jgi:uncharacterized protein
MSIDLSNYAPEFSILMDKQPVPDPGIRKSAVSVQIKENLGNPAEYTLVLSDKLDITKQEFQWLDNPLLEVGNFIRIDIGYAISGLVQMIEGPIKVVSTSGFTSDIPKITLVGYDKSHQFLTQKTTVETSLKPEINDTFSDLAIKVAQQAGLEYSDDTIDKTTSYSDQIIKKAETYRDFLVDSAKRLGFEFFISRNKLFFKNQSNLENSDPRITYEWGKNLMQFTPTINTSELVNGVEIRGTLPDSKQEVAVRASHDNGKNTGIKWITPDEIAKKDSNGKDNIKTISDRIFSSKEEAVVMAQAELKRLDNTLVTGSCTVIGNPILTPGMTIELKNVGRRFSGTYYVTSVINTIDASGYTTRFDVQRSFIG